MNEERLEEHIEVLEQVNKELNNFNFLLEKFIKDLTKEKKSIYNSNRDETQ